MVGNVFGGKHVCICGKVVLLSSRNDYLLTATANTPPIYKYTIAVLSNIIHFLCLVPSTSHNSAPNNSATNCFIIVHSQSQLLFNMVYKCAFIMVSYQKSTEYCYCNE